MAGDAPARASPWRATGATSAAELPVRAATELMANVAPGWTETGLVLPPDGVVVTRD